MLLAETILVALAVIVALTRPTLGAHFFGYVEAFFSRLANRRKLALVVVGLATLTLRIAVLPTEPIPQPSVHDEFAYLLQADTFAHGRLTNTAPRMWQHFETFHVIFQPTYCSKFFPGQGLFLALGQVVFGHPFWGVWLTSGLMCAAITWMLQGWFSPGWAFLGGSIALLRFGVFGYWADSYWGGNVAAIGGALVLGALPRIKSSQRVTDGLLMGLGLALLANSRPWEGLILSLPIAVILLSWMLGKGRPPMKASLFRIVLPLALMVGVTAGCLAYYCWRTTGNPLVTPYQVYEETYAVAPYMLWQKTKAEPVYRHAILRKHHVEQGLAEYNSPFFLRFLRTLAAAEIFFLGPILLVTFFILLLALPYGFSLREVRSSTWILLLILAFFAIGTELAVYYNPHYSAPITALGIALLLIAMQRIREWNRSGLFLSRAIPFACLLAFALRTVASPLHIPASRYSTYYFDDVFAQGFKGTFPRVELQSQLAQTGGKQIVIVRYSPEHLPFPDWVYNDADIEHSKIIWARDMGPAKNQELIDYYKDRQAWLLEADTKPPQLSSYVNHSASQLVAPFYKAAATEAR